jgi:hypothetical protein
MATEPESEATREDSGKWGDPRALAREGGDRLRRNPTLRERRAVAFTCTRGRGEVARYPWEGNPGFRNALRMRPVRA